MYSAKATKKIVLKDRKIQIGETAQFNKPEIEAYGFALEEIKEVKPKGATTKGKGKSTKTSPKTDKEE